jgi:HlyD family secretion protein
MATPPLSHPPEGTLDPTADPSALRQTAPALPPPSAQAEPPTARALALPGTPLAPQPVVSLDEQLEAAIKSPPVGRIIRLALLALLLTMSPFVAWATLTTIEQAVIAEGQLIPESRRKTINLLEPGILRRLLVREGEQVAAGQPLLQLDVTQAEAQADQSRAQFWSGRARIARLRAEQADSRSLTFPEDLQRAAAGDPAVQVFLDAERGLFEARWKNFAGQIAVQERNIAQFQEQIAGVRAQREAAEQQLKSACEQLAGMRTLQRQGLVSLFRLQEMQRLEQTYQGSIGQYSAQEGQLREQVAGARNQLETVRLQRLTDIANDLQATEGVVAQAIQQLRSAEDVLTRREVLSPEAGKVTNIQAFTPGASIASGQAIMDLVPVKDRFIAELKVLPVDIEQVFVGQDVNIRLIPYRVRQLPLLSGRLIHVAPDATTPTQGEGLSYFLVRAEIDSDVLDKVPEVVLQAGMPVEAFILGQERSPLSYFWQPIRNAARRAFRD